MSKDSPRDPQENIPSVPADSTGPVVDQEAEALVMPVVPPVDDTGVINRTPRADDMPRGEDSYGQEAVENTGWNHAPNAEQHGVAQYNTEPENLAPTPETPPHSVPNTMPQAVDPVVVPAPHAVDAPSVDDVVWSDAALSRNEDFKRRTGRDIPSHRERVIAARIRVKADQKLGRNTPKWIIDLSKQDQYAQVTPHPAYVTTNPVGHAPTDHAPNDPGFNASGFNTTPTGSNSPNNVGNSDSDSDSNKSKNAHRWIGAGVALAVVAGGFLVGAGVNSVKNMADSYSAATSWYTPPSTDIGGSGSGVTEGESSSAAQGDWEAVAAKVSASVVTISTSYENGSGGSTGSGVVIGDKGRILTNAHVVSDSKRAIVTLADGRSYDAKVVGVDSLSDIAVLELVKVPSGLSVATFADSDDVKVGQPIMAIGAPLGLSQTITTGIVSALDRPVVTSSTDVESEQGNGANRGNSRDNRSGNGDGTSPRLNTTKTATSAIQIDASINPGNSGGPLFNTSGEVIGINSSIATLSAGANNSGSAQAGSIGLGFSIPSNQAKNIAGQLIENGKAAHGSLGVTTSTSSVDMGDYSLLGAEVVDVSPGTAASKAGIQKGDVIVRVDGNKVAGTDYLVADIRSAAPGTEVTLGVVKSDSNSVSDVKVKLGSDEKASVAKNTPAN